MIGLGSDKNTHLVSPSTVLYTPQACSHRPTVRGGRALVTAWIVHIARLRCIGTSEQICEGVEKHIFSFFENLVEGQPPASWTPSWRALWRGWGCEAGSHRWAPPRPRRSGLCSALTCREIWYDMLSALTCCFNKAIFLDSFKNP